MIDNIIILVMGSAVVLVAVRAVWLERRERVSEKVVNPQRYD